MTGKTKPTMTLPDGTTLREGDYAKLRNGEVVGPLRHEGRLISLLGDYPWEASGESCAAAGNFAFTGPHDTDIIAKATNPCTAKAVAQLDEPVEVHCVQQFAPPKDDTPKLWRDMTDAEKGALLLAHHEGNVIEWLVPNIDHTGSEISKSWAECQSVGYHPHFAYRIKPEPTRETVTLYGAPSKHVQWCLDQCGLDTHKITFDLIDGTPDPASIKMNEVE